MKRMFRFERETSQAVAGCFARPFATVGRMYFGKLACLAALLLPATLALAFVNSRPFMTSNIIGATTMAQLTECIDSESVTLSEEALKRIDAIHHLHMNPCP